ncbi:MAG: 2-oxoglutarate dehydrogenase E1 subunit family protein, partial [Cellulomonadaceae bacterium]
MSANAASKPISAAAAAFGANEWLVDELYEQYLKDKNAVDPAWWDFFADYRPSEKSDTALATPNTDTAPKAPAPAAPAEQAAAPAAPAAKTTSAAKAVPAAKTTSAAPKESGPPRPTQPTSTGRQAQDERSRQVPRQAPSAQPDSSQPSAVPLPRELDKAGPPPVATAQPATAPYAKVPVTRTEATEQDLGSGEVEKLRGP